MVFPKRLIIIPKNLQISGITSFKNLYANVISFIYTNKQAKKIAVTERITANCFFSESYCITTRKAGPGEFGFGVNTLLI